MAFFGVSLVQPALCKINFIIVVAEVTAETMKSITLNTASLHITDTITFIYMNLKLYLQVCLATKCAYLGVNEGFKGCIIFRKFGFVLFCESYMKCFKTSVASCLVLITRLLLSF